MLVYTNSAYQVVILQEEEFLYVVFGYDAAHVVTVYFVPDHVAAVAHVVDLAVLVAADLAAVAHAAGFQAAVVYFVAVPAVDCPVAAWYPAVACYLAAVAHAAGSQAAAAYFVAAPVVDYPAAAGLVFAVAQVADQSVYWQAYYFAACYSADFYFHWQARY